MHSSSLSYAVSAPEPRGDSPAPRARLRASQGCRSRCLELDQVGPGQDYMAGHDRRDGELIDGKLIDIGGLSGNCVDRNDRLVVPEERLGAGVEDRSIRRRASRIGSRSRTRRRRPPSRVIEGTF
jgi:hypothetical protein